MSTATRASRAIWAAGLAALVAFLPVVASAATFIHGPYAGAPSRESVVISWVSSAPLPARIEFGPRSTYEETGVMTRETSVAAFVSDGRNTSTHATLGGLDPSENFVYRVVLIEDGRRTVSPTGAFSTAPGPGEPVSFAVLADTQQQLDGVSRLALVGDAIAADSMSFDFILHAGDVIESPVSTYWDDWFSSFSRMLQRAPFIPVLGNHEKDHRSYYEAFDLPPGAGKEDEQWWALHWGDVVVVGLDSNVSRVADYHAQQDWAREHLSGPEPHKFVIFHHPVFSSDAFHGSGYSYDVIYHPIFVEHGVDIVFNGHAHNYERIERDGIVYLVVGGGGATPRLLAEEHVDGSAVATEGHHFYARVSTSSTGVSVDIVSVAKELQDGTCAKSGGLIDSVSLGDMPKSAEELTQIPWLLLSVVLAGAAAVILLLRPTCE